jgi:pyruvate dehydrogenase E2 component (dihydrolipoamide acetyltransferase)
MGRVTLTLPRLGETMEEARVVDWLVAPGAAYTRGDVLMEVETDKTVVEVPALTDGVLVAALVAPGDTVALGQPFAEAEVAGDATPVAAARTEAPPPPSPPHQGEGRRGAVAHSPTDEVVLRVAASPAARAAARRAGVDLALVAGTGRRGRVTGADVAQAAGAGSGSGSEAWPDGGATTVALVHGLFDHPGGWRDLPARLAAAGLRVVLPVLPGHADGHPAADGLDSAAERVLAQLPPGPAVLVGHSLGAAIATRAAARAPEQVAALVLVAPAGLGPRISADFTDGMLAADTPAALGRALALLDAGPLSAAALASELTRLRAARDGHAATARWAARGGFQQIDIAGDLAGLTIPVAVVFGTGDRILDWQDVAALPSHAAIHLVRGAGHLPHAADPGLILRLARVAVAAGPGQTGMHQRSDDIRKK